MSGWFANDVFALSCACRRASSNDTLREPFNHRSAAPSASRRKAVIALAFAASAVARSPSLLTRPACTTIVTPSATSSAAITPAAATGPRWRATSLRAGRSRSAGARGSAGRQVALDVVGQGGGALVAPSGSFSSALPTIVCRSRVPGRP